jgi:hypothetical protein
MKAAIVALLAAIFAVLSSIAVDLHRLNASLEPLNRIPVADAVAYGKPAETRDQRIDRIARSHIQTIDDARAVEARERELLAERTKQQTAKTPSR